MGQRTREFSIEYEPELVEEAVLAAMRGCREAGEFRVSRDTLYLIPDAEERETRFRAFHTAWFERLGLGEVIAETVRERPSIPAKTDRCLVTLAPSHRDEGAELFVATRAAAAGSATQRTAVLRLRPESLTERDRLRTFLRHELLHLADMLDPQFGYTPGLTLEAGRLPDAVFRERYRVLWDTYVDGRLQRRGWAPPGARAERLQEFATAFPMLGERTGETFERLFEASPHTHADLVAFAAEPERALGRRRRGPHPGERCPLCGSPTYAFEPEPEGFPRALRERIRRSFPAWDPADGLCRQCADLYRAAAGAGAPGGTPRP